MFRVAFVYFRLLLSTKEVVTSVQKMEESLKRLKRMKANSKAEDSSSKPGEIPAMSDDEKIRHQLWLDVHYFAEQVKNVLRVETAIVDELVAFVDEAKSSSAER
jgi:hypothetical protein